MAKLRIKKTTFRRKGKLVRRKSYLRKDVGEPGRTPKSKRWDGEVFKTKTGWSKDLSAEERRDMALDAHDGDILATARGLQALANLSADRETKAKARADADYFFSLYRRGE